ncbi:VWA domain-containing protein [Helicobacter baculiformis]|uniref:VWA domain-containing protein n=1 Tax=Helicobacter baculiformis TaxID=427351 RepID=A0ABV7ZI84_9HELI|nr:VWA domain-containing protein [Helicobacter baculiformis]
MAIDISNYTIEERFIPIFLLLDTSASMNTLMPGGQTRLECLDVCVRLMIDLLKEQARLENFSKLAIITFGLNGVALYTSLSKIETIHFKPLSAGGGNTPLGGALRLARDLIHDKTTFLEKFYTPYTILVSDGEPNDAWEEPLHDFIHNKENRSSKSVRYSVFIGERGKEPQAIKDFSGENIFYADNVDSLIQCFKAITTAVTQKVSPTFAKNPPLQNTNAHNDILDDLDRQIDEL